MYVSPSLYEPEDAVLIELGVDIDENMKAKPDPAVLGKMERILKVKLRGTGLGQPLGGPKKAK